MDTLFFRNPRLVILALLVIIAAGASALVSIGRQEDPTITNIFATVTTPFPGADPGRVEALVTTKIEEELKSIPEIAVIASTSATAVSVVSIELEETIADDRIEQVWSEIRDALADAQRDFPAGVLPPEMNTDGAGGYAAIYAVTAAPGQSAARLARGTDGVLEVHAFDRVLPFQGDLGALALDLRAIRHEC